LRFTENWTLQEIATKYGISRERVRQMVGNSGAGYRQRKIKAYVVNNKDKTNREISLELGVTKGYLGRYRHDHRHAIDGGNLEMGARWEEIVSKILIDHGINNTLMPHHHEFDILLENGKRVDVKAASRTMKPPSSKCYPFYSFGTKKPERGNYCDWICLLFRLTTREGIPFV
jgi:hypothetical protein